MHILNESFYPISKQTTFLVLYGDLIEIHSTLLLGEHYHVILYCLKCSLRVSIKV